MQWVMETSESEKDYLSSGLAKLRSKPGRVNKTQNLNMSSLDNLDNITVLSSEPPPSLHEADDGFEHVEIHAPPKPSKTKGGKSELKVQFKTNPRETKKSQQDFKNNEDDDQYIRVIQADSEFIHQIPIIASSDAIRKPNSERIIAGLDDLEIDDYERAKYIWNRYNSRIQMPGCSRLS
jgi:hypothetical protein